MTAATATIRGRGLFSGREATVVLSRIDGPGTLEASGRSAGFSSLVPRAGARTSVLEGAGVRVTCAEHFFAALGGLGIRDGLHVRIDAEEFPLLDGGALSWCRALLPLGLSPGPSALRVVAQGVVVVGRSEYRFAPGVADARKYAVVFESEAGDTHADWDGTPATFVERIAPARTFVHEADLDELARAGLSASVDPESVIVIDRHGVLVSAGRPCEADEPARHKLLDLVGDLALHGGPPSGHVVARRPSHAATHEAIARAREAGLVGSERIS